ncbi:MAG: cysteine desulfurase [Acidobacteria bacterium]|nr:cysteine desulfurase [Acidobacteriota bacterium]
MDHFYFDHNATAPLCAQALETAVECLREVYGNASSIHFFGQAAKERLERARRQVARLIQAQPKEIVFTSGGTEADNLAILGAVRSSKRPDRHVITTAIEHPAVLNTCAELEREQAAVTYLPAGPDGVVDPEDVGRALRPGTVLVSVMHANNETGVVQPLKEISELTRRAGVLLHSDGVQAAGRIPVNVRELGVDFYTLSGHKICAPKGVGALFARAGAGFEPVTYGGHHERDRRPGTENVPGIAAFGRAAEVVEQELAAQSARIAALRDRLETAILALVSDSFVNGGRAERLPNTTNIRFDDVSGEALVIALDLEGFAVSTGSACSSGAVEPSHVLTAMGLSPEQARASLRFSLGRCNTAEQVDALAGAVVRAVERLRAIAPARLAHV